MNKIKVYIVIMLSILHISVYAQSFESYLKKFQNGFTNVESIKMSMNIYAYSDSLKTDLLHNSNIKLEKNKDDFHYYYGDVEVIANASLYVMVNHYNRFIQVKSRNKKFEENYMNSISNLNFDSLFKNFEKPTLLSEQKNKAHYRVVLKNEDLNKVDFFINTKETKIEAINYHFLNGQFVVIEFENYDENPDFKTGFPHINDFLNFSNDQVFLKEAYSNYKLLK